MISAEMAQQTSNSYVSSKNTSDRVSPIAGSYVKNVAVKLKEQMVESGSQEVLLHTWKSQNAEMAQQKSDGHVSLKNTSDRVLPIAGSYVKNVAVKLKEQMVESGSQEVLLHTRKSQNMRISFSLRGQPGSDAKHSRTLLRGADNSVHKCPGNVAYSSDSRKVTSCVQPVARSVPDPVITLPKSSDAGNISSLDTPSVDVPRTASDVQLASTQLSNGFQSTPMRSVATLNMAMSRDVPIKTGSASADATSFRSGQ